MKPLINFNFIFLWWLPLWRYHLATCEAYLIKFGANTLVPHQVCFSETIAGGMFVGFGKPELGNCGVMLKVFATFSQVPFVLPSLSVCSFLSFFPLVELRLLLWMFQVWPLFSDTPSLPCSIPLRRALRGVIQRLSAGPIDGGLCAILQSIVI